MSDKSWQATIRLGKAIAVTLVASYITAILRAHTFILPEITWVNIVGNALLTGLGLAGWKLRDGPKYP